MRTRIRRWFEGWVAPVGAYEDIPGQLDHWDRGGE
jgi:hypothetical protein